MKAWKPMDARFWREDMPPEGEGDVGDFIEEEDARMSVHDEVVATALGTRETPVERLQRQRDEARTALKGIFAALTQPKTFPADVNYARKIAREALEKD